jgi:hypothetical protein
MLTGRGKARRGRTRRPPARLIVPAAIAVTLGLAVGVIVAAAGRTPATSISKSALGPRATPTVSPAPAGANMDCGLIVPPNPLTASGLATPYQLTGPDGNDAASRHCTQSTPDGQAFVQATILDPATGRLWVYQPLVVTQGSAPAVAPVPPQLPRHAVVNLMVGYNGDSLYLIGAGPQTLARASCVNGLPDSVFGQVSYCNSAAFYAAAYQAIATGKLRVPNNGRSPLTGQRCPTTRSFDLVDQDPSDNVTTKYLLTADGRTAQDNGANRAALPGALPIDNGSDNRLLDNFVLPALGCTPFTAPDLSDAGRPGTSQTLDELSAAVNQRAPVALVPESDPMTMTADGLNAGKTDLYRAGVGQPLLPAGQQADTPANFCANMLNIQTAFIAANQARFAAAPSPVPLTGSNLFTFLAARLSASFANLGCVGFHLHDTVSLTASARGIAVAATLDPGQQEPVITPTARAPAPAMPTPGPSPPWQAPDPSEPWVPWTPWGPGQGGGSGDNPGSWGPGT